MRLYILSLLFEVECFCILIKLDLHGQIVKIVTIQTKDADSAASFKTNITTSFSGTRYQWDEKLESSTPYNQGIKIL